MAQEHPNVDDFEGDDMEEEDEEQQSHPIFGDIARGEGDAVQQRVLADGAVLEERDFLRVTPLMSAIVLHQPATTLWLIEHRGQHKVDTADDNGWTALHYASYRGQLEVVQALVGAGANPAALTGEGWTPLLCASCHADIVTFLLQLPAVKASIDAINQDPDTAISYASRWGEQRTVQLLDAGADPTVPAGPRSPINCALSNNHHAIAALLRHTIAEAGRVRMRVALVGTRKKLCKDLYRKPLEYLLPAWAAKGTAES